MKIETIAAVMYESMRNGRVLSPLPDFSVCTRSNTIYLIHLSPSKTGSLKEARHFNHLPTGHPYCRTRLSRDRFQEVHQLG